MVVISGHLLNASEFISIQDMEEVTDCMDMWSRLIMLSPTQYVTFIYAHKGAETHA